MSILATLMSPTSGVAKVGGFDVTQHPKEVRKRIGYMPDFFGVYDQLKSTEYLHFTGQVTAFRAPSGNSSFRAPGAGQPERQSGYLRRQSLAGHEAAVMPCPVPGA